MSIANLDYSGLFKKVYGDKHNLLPEGFPLLKFVQSIKSGGESHNEAVQLSHENGVSFTGEAGEIGAFEKAADSVVKPATIKCKEIFLSSVLSTGAISNSAGGGEKAFVSATKDRVAANIIAHNRFREHVALYGQDNGIGRVSHITGNFRGVAFTDGSATLAGVVLTNGVNVASKIIALNPSDIASGMLQGSVGMEVELVDLSDMTIADGGDAKGTIKSVDIRNGLIKVDFDPVVSTSVSSHALLLKGQREAKEMIGAKKILTNTGTLFGINGVSYDLWKGTSVAITGKLTLDKIADALEQLCDYGLNKNVEIHIFF